MILCVGTTPTIQRTMLFDRFAIDAVNRSDDVRETASGKAVNVARVLKTIGENALCLGFAGGRTGRFMRDDLDTIGIAHDFVDVPAETRTCVTIIDQSAGVATELVEESKPIARSAWDAFTTRLENHLARARLMVLSGSLPPDAPRDIYARFTHLARERGVPAIVDSTGEPLRAVLADRPMLVKPNRAELAATLGSEINNDASLRQAVQSMIRLGANEVLVTMGAGGAVISDGSLFLHIAPPHDVRVVSPIGSGDAFAGGLAAGFIRGLNIRERAVLGCACAVANAMVPVAGVLRPEDVHRLLGQIQVRDF